MGEYVSLDMGCTWRFESSLFNFIYYEYIENVAQLEECTTKVRSVVQVHSFSIWQIAIARSCIFPLKVPVLLVGRFMPFKSAHWDFLNRGSLWKKNVVRIVENMMTSHGFVSMVIVNIVQTLRNQNAVVNIGRA